MTTIIVSFLCKIEAIEHIRAAVCAAKEYERETALCEQCVTDSDQEAISF